MDEYCTVSTTLLIITHIRVYYHVRTLWEVTHPTDHNALYTALAHLVLTKSGSCKEVVCRIRTVDGKGWLRVQAAFRYRLLGIGCSMRV